MEAEESVDMKNINTSNHMLENMDIFWFRSSTNIPENEISCGPYALFY